MNSWIPGNKSTLLTYTVSNGFAGHLLAGIPLCNNLQNVCATTYKTLLQQPTFLFCNFLQKGLAKNTFNHPHYIMNAPYFEETLVYCPISCYIAE